MAVIVLLGIVLRALELWSQHSFSIDEAALARNVLGRSWRELVQPLDFAQVAPPVFLWLEKVSLALPFDRDIALRLVPFVAGCSTLLLAWVAGRRLFGEQTQSLSFVGLLALSTPLIAYASTVKPYSSDVTASVLVIAAALSAGESTSVRRVLLLGLVSALAVLLSFTAVFALAAAALQSLARIRDARGPTARGRLALYAAICGVGTIAGVVLGRSVMSFSDAAYMKWYWSSGFVPLDHGMGTALRWIWLQATGFFSQTLQYRLATFWLFCAAAGTLSLLRRGRHADAVLLTGPPALVLGAAVLGIYPITTGRIGLFLVPFLLSLVVAGAAAVSAFMRQRLRPFHTAPLIVIGVLAVHAALRSDLPREPGRHALRPFLNQVARDWRPGDALFVHYNEAQPFRYYESTFTFPSADVFVGACSRGSGRQYLRDVNRFAGRSRVWIAMSHEDDIDANLIRRYLDAIGTRTAPQDEDRPRGFGYLYDLSAAAGRGIRADSFPLPEGLTREVPFPYSCYGVFTPDGGRSVQ